MAEIKIILDALSQSDTLDKSLIQLREMVTLLNQIKGTKDALKSATDTANVSRLTAELKKQEDQINKLKAAAADKAAKEKQQTKEQLGLIGQLTQKQRELNTALRSAQSVGEIRKINQELAKTRQQLNAFKNEGKESLNTFGNALESFQFKFNFLGNLLSDIFQGAIRGIKDFVVESIKAFAEAEENAQKLKFAIEGILGASANVTQELIKQSEELQQRSIFSDDSIQQAQRALAVYGLTADEIKRLIPVIIDLASANATELQPVTDAIIGTLETGRNTLKEYGINVKDVGTRTERMSLIIDRAAKVQGAGEAATKTLSGQTRQLKNNIDNLQESLGGVIVGAEDTRSSMNRLSAGFEGGSRAAGALAEKLDAIEKKRQERADRNRMDDALTLEQFAKAQLGKRNVAALTEAQLKQIDTLAARDELERRKKADEELAKQREKAARDREKAAKDERDRARRESFGKFAEFKEEQKNLNEAEELRAAAVREARKLEEEEDQARKDKAEKKRKDDEQAQREALKEFTDFVISELQKQSEAREAALNKQVDDQQTAIERQQELADKGLANTLAFEERKKDELQRAAIEEQQNQERLKKVEAFFNAFAEFSKDDKPEEAVTKALLQVALAEAVSATFAEGGIVDDVTRKGVGGGVRDGVFYGRSHAQGGVIIEAQGQEGIFSVPEMQNLGRDNFYDLKSMLKNPIDDEIFSRQTGNLMQFVQIPKSKDEGILVSEIRELKQIIRDKKETTVDWNKAGDMIIKTVERGVEKVTIRKRRSF